MTEKVLPAYRGVHEQRFNSLSIGGSHSSRRCKPWPYRAAPARSLNEQPTDSPRKQSGKLRGLLGVSVPERG